jgi:hypothetical protein
MIYQLITPIISVVQELKNASFVSLFCSFSRYFVPLGNLEGLIWQEASKTHQVLLKEMPKYPMLIMISYIPNRSGSIKKGHSSILIDKVNQAVTLVLLVVRGLVRSSIILSFLNIFWFQIGHFLHFFDVEMPKIILVN